MYRWSQKQFHMQILQCFKDKIYKMGFMIFLSWFTLCQKIIRISLVVQARKLGIVTEHQLLWVLILLKKYQMGQVVIIPITVATVMVKVIFISLNILCSLFLTHSILCHSVFFSSFGLQLKGQLFRENTSILGLDHILGDFIFHLKYLLVCNNVLIV